MIGGGGEKPLNGGKCEVMMVRRASWWRKGWAGCSHLLGDHSVFSFNVRRGVLQYGG